MKAGDIVLFKFPQTNLSEGKLRPALAITKLPGEYDDWLICMITTKKRQSRSVYDEIIEKSSQEFKRSGLKSESVIRITRLAVVNQGILLGSIGNVSNTLLGRVRKNLSHWINPPE